MHRILVVEDEPLVYDAICTTFALQGGFDLRYAADGERAIAMLADDGTDLALIDVVLPKVSGLEVARYAARRNVPVILMSGHPDTPAACSGARFPILAKPFRVCGLADCVDQLVAESTRLRAELGEQARIGRELVRNGPAAGLDAVAEQWLRICDELLARQCYMR